ncbi:MAG TPA: sulfatase [Planctomycetota bacterium]|nr:sulfatase [Planctomycetota bacterium]
MGLLGASLAACSDAAHRPNILVISVDTLRSDHLGCYGYPRATSPAIDAIAKQGTVFQNAWSSSSWTLPAHATMLTGLPVSAHAQCDWDLAATERFANHLPRGRYISEDLERAGYDTAGFYSCIYLEPKFGFGPGFQTWERAYHSVHSEPGIAERWDSARKAGDTEEMRRIHDENPALFDVEARSAPAAIDSALRWLGGRKSDADPFFLFVHVYDAHTPYTPPPPFDRFDPEYQGTIDGRRLGDADSPVHAGMDPRDLEHVIALYDGEIAAIDDVLERLFAELERSGAADDTLLILTSDHGEEFFEHGGKQHGGNLYRETLQVPLIVKWPGHMAAGARCATTTGLIDIAPTLRAAAGLDADKNLPGADLRELARGKSGPGSRRIVGELTIRRGPEPIWMATLIDGREQTIVRMPGSEGWSAERFDLVLDPRERAEPLHFDAASPQAARLLEDLDSTRSELHRLRERAPARGSRQASDGVVHAQERMALKALGYTGSRDAPVDADRLCLDGCIWRP